jgi:hypothetical protein
VRFIVASALLVASAAAPAQTLDRDEFARGLLRIVEASKDGFRSVRGDVSIRDDKGNPDTWRSTVAIRGIPEIVVFKDFVSFRIGRFRDAEQGRKAYRETVALIRTSLPQAQWQSTGDSIEPTSTGGERGRARFERGKDSNPVVWVSYRATSSGSARVTLFVSNRGGRAPAED